MPSRPSASPGVVSTSRAASLAESSGRARHIRNASLPQHPSTTSSERRSRSAWSCRVVISAALEMVCRCNRIERTAARRSCDTFSSAANSLTAPTVGSAASVTNASLSAPTASSAASGSHGSVSCSSWHSRSSARRGSCSWPAHSAAMSWIDRCDTRLSCLRRCTIADSASGCSSPKRSFRTGTTSAGRASLASIDLPTSTAMALRNAALAATRSGAFVSLSPAFAPCTSSAMSAAGVPTPPSSPICRPMWC
mmetsp:Transcript_4732/g.12127  ORF Transcript_4732/g.12127 Transcript_4732/m.12127 type:complete len:252 (+) Transcript_4732:377-1132(+)